MKRPVSFFLALALTSIAFEAPAQPTEVAQNDLEARRAEAAYRFSLGRLLAEEGAFAEARDALLVALDLDGSDPYIHLALAELYGNLADGARSREARFEHLEQAAAHAVTALESAPENADVLRMYGRIHFSLAERQASALRKARQAFETLRGQQADDLQVLVSLGQIHLWTRDFAAAAEVLREAEQFRPGNEMIQSMLLDALLGSDGLAESAPLLEGMLAAQPASTERRVQLAEVYSRLGKTQRAADVLTNGSAEERKRPPYMRRLAIALHQAGRNEEALPVVDALRADDARDEALTRLRVGILSALTRYEEALATLESWQPETAEEERQQALLRSRFLERLGRGDEAAGLLEDRLQGDGDLQILIGLASVLERSHRVEEARGLLESRLASSSGSDRTLLARILGELLVRAGAPQEAAAVYEKEMRALEAAGDLQVVRQLAVRRLGALGAAEKWDEVLSSAPSLAAAEDPDTTFAGRMALASAQAATGSLDAALVTLAEAETVVPQAQRQLTARKVALLFEHGRPADGRAAIDVLAASDDTDDLLFAAQLLQQQELWKASLGPLEKALADDEDSVAALFSQGVVYERLGDLDKATTLFERLLVQAPDDARTLNYLGYMWADRGENLERALELIRRAVALEPDNGAYVDSLGWAYYRTGDFEAARRYLEWAARLMAHDPTIHEHLGDVYVALRQPDRARDSYRQALELDADDPDQLREKLDRLEGGVDRADEQGP